MRHGNKVNHLGRTYGHRKSMLSNMACSLIEHKRIKTTLAKAKELRKFVEPLITKSKADETHSRRMVFSYLKSKDAVSELFRTVAPKIRERNGGYTRIIKLGYRLGDAAEMCYIELVDFNELLLAEKAGAKKSAVKKSRRGSKKTTAPKAEDTATATDVAEAAPEATAEETPKAPKKKAAPKKEKPADDAAAEGETKE
ncbi:MAG: 50S ribosomal protein L17 [Bacteroidia bacterium]